MAAKKLTGNVVRLPTASPRKVQQPCNKVSRAIVREMRKSWPGEFIYHSERKAMQTAELLLEMHATPELELLTALCAALSEEQRAKVVEVLAPRVAVGCKTAQQALAVLRTTNMTVGESLDLSNAMRRVHATEETA